MNKASTGNNELKLSSQNLIYFIVVLLIIGMVILFGSNALNTPSVADVNAIKEVPNQQSADLTAMNNIQMLEQKLSENPDDFDSLLKLSHLLNDSGFYEKAIINYKKYLNKYPDNVDVIVDMGVCYFQLNKLDEAVLTMKQGIALQPNHQIANFNLGIIYAAKNDHDNSLKYWRKAYTIDPNSDIGIKAKELIDNH